ncbi:MAG: GntP family permease [Gammaproteobacteria bacterium]|nr:GntP family permease [Gammaproteobacteria bacterium]
MEQLFGIIGILLSLVLLMVLAYRGMSVIVLAPVLAMLAVVLSGEGNRLLGIYTQVFMYGVLGFVVKYFPVFLLGAIFGKLMEDSGAARRIALSIIGSLGSSRVILAIVLACAILTYGGVSVFVVVFAVYPIAASIFREANIPKRLIPATVALGSATFTMTCLPGTVQIQNIIPTAYFGTDIYAAPVLGTVCGVLIALGGMLWLRRRLAAIAHEGYGENHVNEPPAFDDSNLPGLAMALAPIVCVIGCNYLFSEILIPQWDTSYLAEAGFGATDVDKLRSLWAMIAGLFLANIVAIAIYLGRYRNVSQTITAGAMSAMLPTFNTGSEVGYGATIASLAAFALVKSAVVNITPGYPLISASLAVNILAGITGSASGGMSIALAALGETYRELATQAGIDLALLHRVVAMSSGGFDTLPHNGFVITIFTICGLTHRQSYKDLGMVTLVIPFTVIFTVTVLLSVAIG